jgi:hypothetical protein
MRGVWVGVKLGNDGNDGNDDTVVARLPLRLIDRRVVGGM